MKKIKVKNPCRIGCVGYLYSLRNPRSIEVSMSNEAVQYFGVDISRKPYEFWLRSVLVIFLLYLVDYQNQL